MKVTSNILQYLGLPSFFTLSALQAAQISDEERYLLNQSNTHNEYKYDENADNENDQNELDKAFLKAAKKGDIISLKKLKNKGANVETTDKDGNNALHWAAMYAGDGKGIKWLIHSANLSIESKGQCEVTPFLCAALKGNLPALKILKNNGANINTTDEYGDNALHLAACYAPEGKCIKWLVHSTNLSTESKGEYQNTPFLCAAEKGNLPALKILKNNGAKTNATNQDGDNALHYAAMYAPEGRGIKWLIHSANLSVESKNNSQKTPFLCAAEKGNLPALKMLKTNGANTNATDQDNDNALWWAKNYSNSQEAIDWLKNICGLKEGLF